MEEHLVLLLLKLAAAAALASILVRPEPFKRLLLVEERTLRQRAMLALSIAAIFGGGVAARVITGTYKAADIGLEGCLIAGLVGGYVPGLLTGVLISLPAMLGHEYLSMPLFTAAGVLGGLVRDAAPDAEEIWRATPYFDRILRNWSDRPRTVFHLLFLASIFAVEFLRYQSSQVFAGRWLFSVYSNADPPGWWTLAAVWFTTVMAVVLPLKIWNNARTESKLEAQQLLTQEARLRALTSQINPHFLFNTLNSIASLVRTNPETARVVIHKLSSILRRLMRKSSDFSTLREELAFIDDYLSIEMVRFGEKLRVVREVEPAALDTLIPSMLLQPLVENSIRHGLASKIEGGTIRLQARRVGDKVQLVVEDDGVGIPEANLAKLFEQGIGVSNVNERLKVLFGGDYRMWVDSRPGEGTRTGIEFPATSQGGTPPEQRLARAS
jgi:two-component system LytT family sensor kinase